jgi:hypothetical protein
MFSYILNMNAITGIYLNKLRTEFYREYICAVKFRKQQKLHKNIERVKYLH